MIRFEPVRAFLDEAHFDFGARLSAFVADTFTSLDPDDDGEARARARSILSLLGEGEWLAPIRDENYRAVGSAREILAAYSPLADSVFAIQALSSTPIRLHGSASVRETWLPLMESGTAMGAFAMTELEAGSDVASMRTRATRDGDSYVIDGSKAFITNAGIADVYVVFASTDPEAGGRGLSAFVVPAKTPGVRFVGAQIMSAPHPLGRIALEGCRVPESSRLGDEGDGLKVGLMTLDRLRATVGAAACGMAGRALHEALHHVTRRRQFGEALSVHQLTREKLARMATDLDAARLLVYRALFEKDSGAPRVSLEASMAKSFATEAAQRIVDDAVQLWGGRGVLSSSMVDHLYRSVRALRIYEGTTEIQRLIVADTLLKRTEADPS